MLRVTQFLRNTQLFFRISPPLPQTSKTTSFRHVKFKRPWIRRFATTFFLYGVAFHVWSSSVLVRFDDTVDHTDAPQKPGSKGKSLNNEHDEEEGNHSRHMEELKDEDPIFIPLGWPRLREAEFYAASDPEWRQFVKISQDPGKLRSLKAELGTLVLGNASRSSILSHMLGGPITLTSSWLVHHFPSRAPPEYRRAGLEIGDNYMAWVTKPMSSEDGDRFQRYMRPLFVTLAVRDASLVFFRRKLNRFRNANLHQGTPESGPILPSSGTTLSSEIQSVDGLSHVSQPESQLPLSNSSQESVTQNNETPDLHPSSIISSLQRLPLPKLGPDSDFYVATLAFKWRLNHCWARESQTPRRGTFSVSGPVGLVGPKGFCRVEVKGEYDPVTSSWATVTMQLKDLNVFHQSALGGRK